MGSTADSLRVAVLAALNLADELSQATSADLHLGHTRATKPADAAGRSAGEGLTILPAPADACEPEGFGMLLKPGGCLIALLLLPLRQLRQV